MSHSIRCVAIIGTGPSGAIATNALVKEGAFDTIRIFDRRDGVGGKLQDIRATFPARIPSMEDLVSGRDDTAAIPENLPTITSQTLEINRHRRRFSDTAIHENLQGNIIPAIIDRLSNRVVDEYGPTATFRHHTIIREWVEGIIFTGNHEQLELLEERILRRVGRCVRPLQRAPVLDVDGLVNYDKKFPGTIQHSNQFPRASNYKDKPFKQRTLVVGASVSAHEIIHEIFHEILDLVEGPVYSSIPGDPIPAFYYSIAPNYAEFFEFFTDIAAPLPGGRRYEWMRVASVRSKMARFVGRNDQRRGGPMKTEKWGC
ncbi:hypothetical protein jhhlp_008172 [Lomentospora prolificans]|uniref:FAD/NAD(P)-binding domain-containing protein n=1 Tax=Lomentospora prolificans TaxID=41688 RepID=A0A2N3MZP4_9PEZI|nr:hypothetical protein jhhlp_008172 [Lomentospora prolificans]